MRRRGVCTVGWVAERCGRGRRFSHSPAGEAPGAPSGARLVCWAGAMSVVRCDGGMGVIRRRGVCMVGVRLSGAGQQVSGQ